MTASSREPVLIASAILAGLQVVVAGSSLSDVIGVKVAGLLGLLVAGATMALGVYTRGLVTPVGDVAAKENHHGDLVAGPASDTHAGITEGTPVDIVADITPPRDIEHDDLTFGR